MHIYILYMRTGLKSYERRSFVAAADVVEALLALIKSHHCSEGAAAGAAAAAAGAAGAAAAAVVNKGEGIDRKLIPRVLNIGGPAGLTRLQVAEILCEKLRVPLRVDASQQHTPPPRPTASTAADTSTGSANKSDDKGDADVWRIYDQKQEPVSAHINTTLTTPAKTSTFNIQEVIILTSTQPLQTPLDLTMSVAETENALNLLNLRFRPLSEYILDCIAVD